jgi:16S rRNA C967 or C1407 C5-methylase (RsmB/RsmF family)
MIKSNGAKNQRLCECTHLSELAPLSKIIALDSDADRLKRVQENIERFSIKNITLFQGKAQTQDCILALSVLT